MCMINKFGKLDLFVVGINLVEETSNMNWFLQKKNIVAIFFGVLITCTIGYIAPNNIHAQSVNSYIYSNNLKHASITNAQWAGFPHPNYEHGYGKPEGVVVHETGNPNSSIFGEMSFMKGNFDLAFVHSFVDADRIINIANTNYGSWGAGYPANAKFVQFEQVEMHSAYSFASEVNNSAYYTAYLLHQYKLPCTFASSTNGWNGTVFSHYATTMKWHQTDHVDPVTYFDNAGRQFFGQPYTMNDFFQLVKKYYDQENSNTDSSLKYVDINASAIIKPTNNVLYNHVPGSGYKIKKITKANKLTRNKVYIDSKAYTSYNQPYYRISYKGKRLGWIYASAVTNISDGLHYSSVKATAKVKPSASHKIFNHISSSKYKAKAVVAAKTLTNKTVTVTGKAQMNGKRSGYYKISSNGKNLGWLYESDLTDITDNIQYTGVHVTAKVKMSANNDFYNHITKSAYIASKNNNGMAFRGRSVVIDCKAYVPGVKNAYYRVSLGNKRLGWIYGGSLENFNDETKYETSHGSAVISSSVGSNNIYNHIPGSYYNISKITYGNSYKGKSVTFDCIGHIANDSTPYYRVKVDGHINGWISGRGLSSIKSKK